MFDFFSDSFLVSKCCDLLLELVNLRVLPKTHKVQKSKGNDRIMKKFWKSIIYGMIWMWLKFGDDRVTSKTLATRPDPYPPPQTSTHLSPFILRRLVSQFTAQTCFWILCSGKSSYTYVAPTRNIRFCKNMIDFRNCGHVSK